MQEEDGTKKIKEKTEANTIYTPKTGVVSLIPSAACFD